MPTKREIQEREWTIDALERMGFTEDEFHALRRISLTLRRWFEHECNGNIQREGDDGEGAPRWHRLNHSFLDPRDPRASYRIPDREKGARKRLAKIMASHPGFLAHVQSDPRGAALHILDRAKLGDRDASAYYSSVGIAIY